MHNPKAILLKLPDKIGYAMRKDSLKYLALASNLLVVVGVLYALDFPRMENPYLIFLVVPYAVSAIALLLKRNYLFLSIALFINSLLAFIIIVVSVLGAPGGMYNGFELTDYLLCFLIYVAPVVLNIKATRNKMRPRKANKSSQPTP